MKTLIRGYRYILSLSPLNSIILIFGRMIYGIIPFVNATLLYNFTDSVTSSTGDYTQAIVSLAALLGTQVIMALFSVFFTYVNTKFYNHMVTATYLRIASLIDTIPSEYLEIEEHQRHVEYLLSNSMWSCYRFFNITINVFQAVVSLVSFIIFIFLNNQIITICYALVLLFYILLMTFTGKKEYQLTDELFDDDRKLHNLSDIIYNMNYAKELRIFQYGKFMVDKWKLLAERLMKPRIRLQVKNSVARNLYFIFINCFILLFFISTGFGIQNGLLEIAVVSAIVSYLPDLNYAIGQVGDSGKLFGENYHLLKDFFDYSDTVQSMQPSRTIRFQKEFEHKIEFKNVHFTYPGGSDEVLRGINASIRKGETVAFVGENGAGKTTLAYLLAGIYTPTEGVITIDGIDYSQINKEDIHCKINYVGQITHKFGLSFDDNVYLGRDKSKDLTELIHDIGLDDLLSSFPHKREEILGRSFGQIDVSGGEWQKISILRCFAADKEIYIMDEPTSALDPRAEYKMFEIFKRETVNKTSVLISHRLGALKTVDRIFYLERGLIVESGTHDELLALNGKYADMFRAQRKWYQ